MSDPSNPFSTSTGRNGIVIGYVGSVAAIQDLLEFRSGATSFTNVILLGDLRCVTGTLPGLLTPMDGSVRLPASLAANMIAAGIAKAA